MAFNKDVTQNLNPASANPGTAARAEALRAETVGSAIRAVGTGIDMYKHMTMKDLEATAEQETINFMQSQMDAKQSGIAAGNMVEKAKEEAQRMTLFEQEGEGAQGYADAKQRLQGFLYAAERYKQAYDAGGMKPEEFVTRVQGHVKQAIAKFPGMANEIRQLVAQTTGLPYVDDATAAARYTRELFADAKKPEGKDTTAEFALKQDIENIVKYVGHSAEDLLTWHRTKDPRYNDALRQAREAMGYEITQKDFAARKNALQQQGGEAAQRGTAIAIDEATVKITQDAFNYTRANAPLFDSISKALTAGGTEGLRSSPAIVTQLQIMQGEFQGYINKHTLAARTELLKARERGVINAEQYKDLTDQLTERNKIWLAAIDKDNLLNTATIMANHREKSIAENLRMATTLTEWLKLFGDSELAKKYMSGTDADKEEIAKIAPNLVKVLKPAIDQVTGFVSASGAAVQDNGLMQVGRTIVDAKDNPNASPKPQPGTANPTQAVQVNSESVIVEARNIIQKIKDNPITISAQQANVLGTRLNNMTAYGTPDADLAKDWKGHADLFSKLPENYKSTIKASVSEQHITTSNAIVSGTKQFDETGVKLEIGVRPDGTIGVIPPYHLLVDGTAGFRYRDNTDYLYKKYPSAFKGKMIDPNKVAEYKAYERAAQQWENNYFVRANNMVLSRSIVTGEQPTKVGQEYAYMFNQRQAAPGFFDNTPKPVQPKTENAQTTSNTSNAGTPWWRQ